MIESIPQPWTVRGRNFSKDELLRIRALVETSPHDPRSVLSRKICEALDWRQHNGRLKDRSCRDVLLRLHDLGFLKLPPRRVEAPRRRPVPITAKTDPRLPAPFSPRDLTPAAFFVVTRCGSRALERLWNEYVERYHYLRYGVPVGPHIKYFVRSGGEPIACLAFSGAAWKVGPRDRWIGWQKAQREANLRFIVNNSRFLILPWIRVDNLASRLLSLATRRLLDDWERLYAYRPLLVETFVLADRHVGTCYRASNWLCVGTTQGRGKMDRHHLAAVPKKLVFLRPLVTKARERLASMPPNGDP
jgi:hypothetical protein